MTPASQPDEAALRSELTALRERCRRQAAVIRQQQLAAERRNLELDALHLVWCDGGCPGGVHRYQRGDIRVTEELVRAAERNTRRLRTWYEAVKSRHDAGPAAAGWRQGYAEWAAGRAGVMTPPDTPAP